MVNPKGAAMTSQSSKNVKSILLLILISIFFSTTTFAQETMTCATVSGVVSDATGAVIPNATVTAKQIDTNLLSTTSTDAQGRYRFPYPHVGTYEIAVH